MKVGNLLPDFEMNNSEQAMLHLAKKLAARVDDLEDMLANEIDRSNHLESILGMIAGYAHTGVSSTSGRRYIGFGYIWDEHIMFDEIFDALELKEDKKCEDIV